MDNALWITAAAEGRLLCGGRGRRCGGSVNAGKEVQTQTGRVRKSSRAMDARRGRLSAPWPRFHGADRADVYIIIRVRACCCGECALNPPPSPPILRRRLPLAPAQRHALPEHFRPPPQPRRTPADLTTHSPPKICSHPEHFLTPFRALPLPLAAPTHTRRPHNTFPVEDLRPARALSHPLPAHFHSPRSPDAHPPTSQHIPHRRSAPAPAQRRALPEHFLTPSPPRRTPAGCAMHSSPTSQHIPRRRPAPAPAQRHALPEHFLTPSPPRRTPAGCAMHARRPHNPFLAEGRHPSPHSDTCLPFCSASGTKKRHRTVDVRCRMSRSTVVAVGHWGW